MQGVMRKVGSASPASPLLDAQLFKLVACANHLRIVFGVTQQRSAMMALSMAG